LAPQVAKHLKDGCLKEAIALGVEGTLQSPRKSLAGLQEYQFQQRQARESQP
jgi:hypothetical protein